MSPVVFTTLFLALTNGPQTVEWSCRADVAAVEVLLDGERIARVTAPPWSAPVDLGAELAPHRLEAVAHDRRGVELGRAEQWINLPRARAEVSLLVERPDRGPAIARISWRSVDHAEPTSVRVALDGVPVASGSADRGVPLPELDPRTPHVLSAEVTFPDASSARDDVLLGGVYGGATATSLSAVAVRVDGRKRLRRPQEAGPWLRVDGEPVPVHAVDRGPAAIYTVVDAGALPHLLPLGRALALRTGGYVPEGLPIARTGAADEPYRLVVHRGAGGRLREAGMHEDDLLRLVHPRPVRSAAGHPLFGISPPLDRPSVGGPAWLLSHLRLVDRSGPQRLADAVAAAGLDAAGVGRPRAVMLVVGPRPEDASRFAAETVRGYLARLGIPLFVAFVEDPERGVPPEDPARERLLAAATAARVRHLDRARRTWGAATVDVASLSDWIAFHRESRREISRQRILWIDGSHAPHRVRLVGAPAWVEPIGSAADP